MSQNSDVVVYHNDLNKLNLGNFSELEQNLLMIVLVACKKSKNVEIKMTAIDLLKFMNKNLTNHELFEISANLKDNFFKLDFTIVKKIEESGSINRFLKSTYNLFSKFDIYYVGNDLLAEKDPNSKLEYIELKVNPEFAYLINEITAHFTEFELEEFICIRSKYAKTLYRLLKQFRNTGWASFDYKDFKKKMGIPESYQQCTIKKQILDPSIKILKSEIKTNLFDARVPFKNLQYEFVKADLNGKRGARPIDKIKFTFDIDSIESKNENQEIKAIESKSNEIQANPQKVKEIIKTAYSKSFKNNIKSDEENIAFAKSYIDRKINLYNPNLNVWSVIRLKSINFNNLHDIISYYEDIDTLKEVVLKHTSLDYLNNFLAKNAI